MGLFSLVVNGQDGRRDVHRDVRGTLRYWRWLEAVLGIQSSFKRTPKYRIESRKDILKERMKYALPLDKMSFLELFMGIYCLVLIYFTVKTDRLFILPFLLLYASGFFYVSFLSIFESSYFSGKKNRVNLAQEVALKST